MNILPRFAAMGALAALTACTVGPNYVKPAAPVPIKYKEAEGWQPAEPKVAGSDESWWSVYDDPILDGLEKQVIVSNETLQASEAAYREALALVAEATAGYFPSLSLTGSAVRSGGGAGGGRSSSGSRSTSSGATTTGGGTSGFAQNSYAATAQASWAPDVWGAIARDVESEVAGAQASAADLAAAQLSEQTTLATDYFELRISDDTARLLSDAVAAYARSLQITQNKYNAGTAARSDVATAQATLENARSSLLAAGVQRAVYEHAIAVLIGKAPADLSIEAKKLSYSIAVPPAGMPSTLLERNPTIAAAERTMQEENAKIGEAIAGYFPTFTFGASYGQSSSLLHTLFTAASSLWSFGLTNVNLPIFNGGLTAAQVAFARASYDAAVADYRQAVLNGFETVEDELSSSRILADQGVVQGRAVAAAKLAEQLTMNQYLAGTVDYTTVVTAQATSLASQETALSIMQSRLLASVLLIEGLGGGWQTQDLPSPDQVKHPAADVQSPPDAPSNQAPPASNPPAATPETSKAAPTAQ